MISVTHFASAESDFADRATRALDALAARPGYLRGTVARSTDSGEDWLLITEWQNVGSYRRALGSYEVKLHAAPLLGEALAGPSAFEPLIEIDGGGELTVRSSDRA